MSLKASGPSISFLAFEMAASMAAGRYCLSLIRQVVEGQAHHALLVVLVVDDVIAGQAERRAILAQPARAQRVKRAGGEQPQPGAL